MTETLFTLEDLYIDELRDLYHAESELADTLPQLASAATSEKLRHAFEEDARRTRYHLQRLDAIFTRMGKTPSGHRCKGMEGLLREGRDRIAQNADPQVLDAGLIVLAQKAQHYEIAGYGSATTFARLLNRDEDVAILEQTLEDEKLVDSEFTDIAVHAINPAAAAA